MATTMQHHAKHSLPVNFPCISWDYYKGLSQKPPYLKYLTYGHDSDMMFILSAPPRNISDRNKAR